MLAAPDVVPAPSPASRRDGWALCLSGGGYRAALFHLGALRRLNECGVLGELAMISSVSGGSIVSAHLARTVVPWPEPGGIFPDWDARVAEPFRAFCRCDIRTPALFFSLLNPWRMLREGLNPAALETAYRRLLTRQMLRDLPERPRFVFCATELMTATLWRFERSGFGSYRTGSIRERPDDSVAHAVAASSCFPPVFAPMHPCAEERLRDVVVDGRPLSPAGLRLSDGGLYDNLGLQPAIARHATILVSDGGAPFDFVRTRGLLPTMKRFADVLARQIANLRWREFHHLRDEGAIKGGYWNIAGGAADADGADGRYSEYFARQVVATIRTDLNSFTPVEAGVLENHGYWQADATLQKHAAALGLGALPAPKAPRPELCDERALERGMKDRDRWLPSNLLAALAALWRHRRLPRQPPYPL